MFHNLAEFYEENSLDMAKHVIDGRLPNESPLNLNSWSLLAAHQDGTVSPRTWAYYFDAHAKVLATLQSPNSQIASPQRKCY